MNFAIDRNIVNKATYTTIKGDKNSRMKQLIGIELRGRLETYEKSKIIPKI